MATYCFSQTHLVHADRRFFEDHYQERSLYRSHESIDSYSDESGHCSVHHSSTFRRPSVPSSADSPTSPPATRKRVLIVLTRCAVMLHAYDGRKQQPETHTQELRIYCPKLTLCACMLMTGASSSILVALLLHGVSRLPAYTFKERAFKDHSFSPVFSLHQHTSFQPFSCVCMHAHWQTHD